MNNPEDAHWRTSRIVTPKLGKTTPSAPRPGAPTGFPGAGGRVRERAHATGLTLASRHPLGLWANPFKSPVGRRLHEAVVGRDTAETLNLLGKNFSAKATADAGLACRLGRLEPNGIPSLVPREDWSGFPGSPPAPFFDPSPFAPSRSLPARAGL
jgi:hypothetical protein